MVLSAFLALLLVWTIGTVSFRRHFFHGKGLPGQQRRNKGASCSAVKPLFNSGFCSSIGLQRVVRASGERTRSLILWRLWKKFVCWANSYVGIQSDPAPPPRRALCPDAPMVFGFFPDMPCMKALNETIKLCSICRQLGKKVLFVPFLNIVKPQMNRLPSPVSVPPSAWIEFRLFVLLGENSSAVSPMLWKCEEGLLPRQQLCLADSPARPCPASPLCAPTRSAVLLCFG